MAVTHLEQENMSPYSLWVTRRNQKEQEQRAGKPSPGILFSMTREQNNKKLKLGRISVC